MTAAAGEVVSIKVLVEDAGSVPVARVREQFAQLGETAVQASAAATSALGRTDVALGRTAEQAAAAGAAMAGAAIKSVSASEELGAAATLASLRATEAMTRYQQALLAVAAGTDAVTAGVARFGAEATLAAGQAKAALAAYAVATKEAAAAAGAEGAVAGHSFGHRFGEGAMESAKMIIGPLLAMFAAFKVVEFLGESISEGNEEKTSIRRVKQEFGEASEEVLAFGEHANDAFLLSAKAANTLAANFGNFLHSFGIVGPQAAEMSVKLTGLAADMAKYHGDSDTTGVERALDSALKGRPILLKQYGVAINDTTIAEAARAHGIGNGITALTAAQKAEAIYQSLLEQTAKQQGAVERSAGTLGYEKKRLANAMENLQAQIGMALIPVLASAASLITTAVVPALHLIFLAIKPLLDLIVAMPKPVQVMTLAFIAFLLLRSRIVTMLTDLWKSLRLTRDEAGKFGSAWGRMGSALMAGGVFLVATQVINGVNREIERTADVAKASTERVNGLAASFGDVSAEGKKAQRELAFKNLEETDGGSIVAWAKSQKIGMDQLTDAYLGLPSGDAVRAKLEAYANSLDMGGLGKAGRVSSNILGQSAESDALDALQNRADSIRAILGEAASAASKTTDENAAAGEAAAAGATEQVNELTGATDVLTDAAIKAQAALEIKKKVVTSWTDLDTTVANIIKKLDVLAGRNATAEQAQEDLDKVATDFKSTFLLGQAGQKRLDPSKVLNADGSVNTTTTAGQDLRDSTIQRQEALVKAAQAASDAVVQKGGTVEAGKEAAQKVLDDGYTKFIDQNAVLLGSKDAAEKLAKAYGIMPEQIITDVTANTEEASKNLKEIIRLQGIVAGGTTAGDAEGEAGAAGEGGGSTEAKVPDITAGTFDSDKYRNSSEAGAARAVHPADSAYGPLGSLVGKVGAGLAGAVGGGLTLPAGTPVASGVPNAAMVAEAGKGYPDVVTRWAPQIAKADALVGLPQTLQSWQDAFLRINRESTGDPNVTQKVIDINSLSGDPAKGLVQTTGQTFRAYALPGYDTNIFDPVSNLAAGMNYSKSRYGSVHAGFSKAGGYDQGGWLPAGGIAVSNLKVPEAILNPEQWASAKHAMTRPSGSVTVEAGAFPITVTGTREADLVELRRNVAKIFKEEAERRR